MIAHFKHIFKTLLNLTKQNLCSAIDRWIAIIIQNDIFVEFKLIV